MKNYLKHWFLIYTRPKQEKKIFAASSALKIDSFLPLKKTIRTWSDRKKCIVAPLFPSYIFVRPEDAEIFFSVLGVEGVLYYLRTGKEIAKVDENLVNDLKLLTSDEQELEVSNGYFKAGDKLIIEKGPLTGFLCEVVNKDNKKKILVRLDLLKSRVLATIPYESAARVA